MKNLVVVLLFALTLPVSAQTGLKEKADREFEKMRFAYAIDYYEQYLKKNSADDSARYKLAVSYHKVKDTKNSEKIFRSISNLDGFPSEAWLEFAEVLSQNGNYEEAHSWYLKYAKVKHLDERALKNLEAHSNVQKFYLDSTQYRIYHLGFNSLQSDFSPAFYKNGIVFSSGRVQEHGVRRVFSWDNSAFLDLYFVDTTAIDTTHFVTDRKHTKSTREELHASTKKEPVHHDDTRITRTIPIHLGIMRQPLIRIRCGNQATMRMLFRSPRRSTASIMKGRLFSQAIRTRYSLRATTSGPVNTKPVKKILMN